MTRNIQWLGHDTFRIAGSQKIYTDPFKIKKKDVANLILITHEHYDHCSPEDVAKLRGPDTVVIAPPDCAQKLDGAVKTVRPGDSMTVNGVSIRVVPAYNTNKAFHTKDRGWVGYLITMDGKTIYLAGDTDRIPEMSSLPPIDVALLPVSGTYVMTAIEAADAARILKPGLAIPMHYGSVVGTIEDAEKFASLLKGLIPVVILPEE